MHSDYLIENRLTEASKLCLRSESFHDALIERKIASLCSLLGANLGFSFSTTRGETATSSIPGKHFNAMALMALDSTLDLLDFALLGDGLSVIWSGRSVQHKKED